MSVDSWWSVTDEGQTVDLGGKPAAVFVRATWTGLELNLPLRSESPAFN